MSENIPLIKKLETKVKNYRAKVRDADKACEKAFMEIVATSDNEHAELISKLVLMKIIREECYDKQNKEHKCKHHYNS